jgi:hypothetical protein
MNPESIEVCLNAHPAAVVAAAAYAIACVSFFVGYRLGAITEGLRRPRLNRAPSQRANEYGELDERGR